MTSSWAYPGEQPSYSVALPVEHDEPRFSELHYVTPDELHGYHGDVLSLDPSVHVDETMQPYKRARVAIDTSRPDPAESPREIMRTRIIEPFQELKALYDAIHKPEHLLLKIELDQSFKVRTYAEPGEGTRLRSRASSFSADRNRTCANRLRKETLERAV